MVRTPWYDHPIPFEEAAEIGTKKVITDHSTMGILITTDGTITDLPREAYVSAEERVVSELQELNKPFIVVLNSTQPYEEETIALAEELEEKYEVPVMPIDVANLDEEGIMNILEEILFEFPVSEVNIGLPRWIEELDCEHWLRAKFEDAVHNAISEVKRLRDIDQPSKPWLRMILSKTSCWKIWIWPPALPLSRWPQRMICSTASTVKSVA